VTKFALSIIAASLLTGTAYAADLQVYAPVVEMNDPVAAGNFYASVFGGAAMINDFDFESSIGGSGTVSFDRGYSVDAALGYDFGNGLSLEGQVGYLNADLSDGSYNDNPLLAEGTASVTYGMINAWYGFDLGGITPFIGGGVGVASLALDSEFTGFPDSAIDDSAVTWAAQIGAGVSFALTENISLAGRYRYLTTGEVSLTDSANFPDPGDENTGSASASILDIGLKVAF